MKKLLLQQVFLIWTLLLLVACADHVPVVPLAAQTIPSIEPYQTSLTDQSPRLRVEGNQIVTALDEAIHLKGIAFGNEVWNGDVLPLEHHNEQDYIRIKKLGFNSIRFYLNYQFFESDQSPFIYHASAWEWLDKNVAWAEKHGIYLIFNMHVPQGGYQSQGKGGALWDQALLQLRLKRLWQAIAIRYQSSPYVAGYDLVNEPIVTRSKQQWIDLATDLTEGIREVNQQQMIFVERLLAVKGQWQVDEQQNFFKLDDPNVVYQYHFYQPMGFTHQQANWLSDYQVPSHYPDLSRYKVLGDLKWERPSSDSAYLETNDAQWRLLNSDIWRANDTTIKAVVPALVVRNVPGVAEFKDVELRRYPPGSEQADQVIPLELMAGNGWYFWSVSEQGDVNFVAPNQVRIAATNSDANLSNWSLVQAAKPGYGYQLSGLAKVKQAGGGQVQLRLDLLSSTEAILAWDKPLLEAEISKIEQWAQQQQVPIYLGEFGCIRGCFVDDKGGLNWVRDMLSILRKNGTHYNYHAYHEYWFSLYDNVGLPIEGGLNHGLRDVFMEMNQAQSD